MMRSKYLLALFALLLLTACQKKFPNPKQGELQHQLFKECMELSSKITRQGDDDVSDIIHRCGVQAQHLANNMRPQ